MRSIAYGFCWLVALSLMAFFALSYLTVLWCLDGGLRGLVDFLGEHAGDFE